ncbi:YtxH domain-containing protein [Rossellomorea vietnamensis]|uniref:YtxH domain-containing protein n=1 Tax=Rossellomorea vietnamensis TaxID=218284 RepID=A0A5D4KKX4_9BACI|nr:YtxH domain-containing protein [Rossellomorea vietnamensis]TYR77385.1 YtxH domain-containing protein [Rossellomorea vietnamensis]
MTQTVSYNNTNVSSNEEEKNGKLVKGMVLGAVVGGALAMLDSTTRQKVTSNTKNMKDSTMDMVGQVRNDPSGVKSDLQDRLSSAQSVLKEAINDAQNLYEKVNGDIIGQVNQVKEESTEILSTAKEATSDLKDIGGKVKEAGEEVMDESSNQTGGSVNSRSTSNSSTGFNNTSSTSNSSDKKIPGQLG